LAFEKFSKNGVSKELHVIAKNIAFTLQVFSTMNLQSSPLSASLVYDFDTQDDVKEVDTLKSSPMEYVSHVDETTHRSVVEVRVSVLSSQHEGSFFRVKFSVLDPETKKKVETYSHPLKIISKRNQVRKMMARNEVIVENPGALPPKRTSSDQIAESLQRLEEQQRLQFNILEALAQKVISSSPAPSSGFNYQPPSSLPDPEDMDFDNAFNNFLRAYKKISVEERPSKMKRIVKQHSEDMDTLNDFVNLYSSEILMQTPDSANMLNSLLMPSTTCSSSCTGDCPHKKELERLDNFYHEFLFEPNSPGMETA